MKLRSSERPGTFGHKNLYRWLYLGRLTLAAGIFLGALLVWGDARPDQTLIVTVFLLAALGVTAASAWHTHINEVEPGDNFAYGQVIFDALLVTAVVHVTGGPESNFPPLYILVVTAGALLLPLRGGVLVGFLASILYFADTVWGHEAPVNAGVLLQMGLFTLVAVVTGWVADRLRRAGMVLGAVESELRQLRMDTGDILDNISTGVLTVDGTGRLMYLNEAGEDLLGLDAVQWDGAPVMDAVESSAPGLGTILERSIESRVPSTRSKVITSRQGREVTLGVSTAVLEREEGALPSVTAIFQDITDQERLEALDRRTDRLEAVAELSASLAHEIKNPLASIRSAVEQIAKPSLGSRDRQSLRKLVVKESDRLSRLLSEFIEFSAVRMGERREVDLTELVEDSLALVRQHPDADGSVAVEFRSPDDPVRITADPDLLHRAVFNLVLNGVQFSASGGTVTVGVRDCTGFPYPRGARISDPVELCVRDAGPGIPPEEVPRIFDPFYTTRRGGSGLGLAVVHRAVEAHDGAIFVDAPEAGGTEFVIFLPGGEREGGLRGRAVGSGRPSARAGDETMGSGRGEEGSGGSGAGSREEMEAGREAGS